MSHLLFSISSIRILAREFFPTTLYIYDENMVYIKRWLFKRNECTISYNHVSQVYLRKGYITASLEVINTGGVENIEIKWLKINEALKAKKLIDEKITLAHGRISTKTQEFSSSSTDVEKKIARLKELKLKGVITGSEFEYKRKEVLKSL